MTTDGSVPGEPEPSASVCPECGHPEIDTYWSLCPIQFGASPNTVELPVRLPVRKCRKCSFEFFDEEAEDLRHEAVCRHLGVHSPSEIMALRDKLRMSRAEFARLTGLGEATIARWERGELIQNEANDNFLWLLHDDKNVQRLRRRLNRSAAPVALLIGDPNDRVMREKERAYLEREFGRSQAS